MAINFLEEKSVGLCGQIGNVAISRTKKRKKLCCVRDQSKCFLEIKTEKKEMSRDRDQEKKERSCLEFKKRKRKIIEFKTETIGEH